MKTKKTSIEMVKEFHETFGHLISEKPTIPPTELTKFRVEFMQEESAETIKACEENNLVELADGLGDLQYVLDGWFLNAGLHKKKDEILAEIHRSNMTKLCKTEEEAIKSVQHINNNLKNQDDLVSYRKSDNGLGFVIYRIRDGKIGKSIFYEKPNLREIILGK